MRWNERKRNGEQAARRSHRRASPAAPSGDGHGRWAASARAAMALAATALAALGCSDGGAGDGPDSEAAAAVLHPGACRADLVWADGKRADRFLVWSYDAKGRKVREDRLDDAVATGFPTSTTLWTWTDAGLMASEVLTTSDKAVPNHDWTWTYDGDGRPATRVGSTSAYKTESCTYEYSKVATHPHDFVIVCNYSYDTFDKEGNRTGTVTGTHAEQHTFYEDLPGAAYGIDGKVRREVVVRDDGKGGKPGGETAYVYDADGRLLATEQDSKLQGYPDDVTKRTYDAKGRLATRSEDDNGDGTAELLATWSYDGAGNVEQVAFDVGADGSVDHRWEHHYDCW